MAKNNELHLLWNKFEDAKPVLTAGPVEILVGAPNLSNWYRALYQAGPPTGSYVVIYDSNYILSGYDKPKIEQFTHWCYAPEIPLS